MLKYTIKYSATGMWLLKVLILFGSKLSRLVIDFPKHMLIHWLQPIELQKGLEYFKSYLKQTNKQAKKQKSHHFYKLISISAFSYG